MTDQTDDTNPNPNVIITKTTRNSHSYHTTVCRNVWLIPEKQYITEERAQRRGLTECDYCSGAFEPGGGTKDAYMTLKNATPEDAYVE